MKKLKLENLKITSFVTSLESVNTNAIVGGTGRTLECETSLEAGCVPNAASNQWTIGKDCTANPGVCPNCITHPLNPECATDANNCATDANWCGDVTLVC